MPRPKKELTDEQVDELETLAAVLNQEQIANYFGMSPNTLRARMQEDEAILAAYKRGKAKAIEEVGGHLLEQARDGNTTAIIFYLKTQAGWKETQKLEHEGVMTLEQALRQLEAEDGE